MRLRACIALVAGVNTEVMISNIEWKDIADPPVCGEFVIIT